MKGLRKRNRTTWEGRIYNSKKKPSYKSFYFSEDEYSQKEIEDLWSDMRRAYKAREFDPWEDEVIYSESHLASVENVCREFIELSKSKHSKRTTNNYRTTLQQVQDEVGTHTPIEDVKAGQLDRLVNSFAKKTTRKAKASTINVFLDFAFRNGYIARPFKIDPHGGDGRKIKDYVTLEELRYIEEQIKRKYKRDYPLIEMLYAMFFLGFRASELLAFKPSWINKDMRTITYGDQTFQPKGRDIGSLDILPILDEYKDRLADVIRGLDPYDNVFTHYHLTYITEKVMKVMDKIFPKKYLTAHSFRKSLAMYLIEEKGLHPKAVHEMMRHASMNTTMQYYTSKEIDQLDMAINPKQCKNSVINGKTEINKPHKSMGTNNLRLVSLE